MHKQQEKWNDFYSQEKSSTKDDWLEKYHEYFEGGVKVLDLGCGSGSNIPFLLKLGAEITAIDYSENAIMSVRNKWGVNSFVYDIRETLPFGEKYFDLVLADLSLHYFTLVETVKIMHDLYRILTNKGILIARVNSIKDKNHGFGVGAEIEEYYFDNDGARKRFYDKEMVYDIFDDDFVIVKAIEKTTDKYVDEKVLWEIVTIKIA